MADDSQNAPANSGTGGGAAPDTADAGGGQGSTPDATAKPPKPRKLGRRILNHGPAADARREADARYLERKRAAARGEPPPPQSAPIKGPGTGTTPGYYKQLVKVHEQLAKALEMPELRIEPEAALELERNALVVLGDRGISMRSETAHLVALLGCFLAIYVPIGLAVLVRMRKRQMTPLPTHVPQKKPEPEEPDWQPPEAPKPWTPEVAAGATFVPGQFPEQSHHTMPGAQVVHGAFSGTLGAPGITRL